MPDDPKADKLPPTVAALEKGINERKPDGVESAGSPLQTSTVIPTLESRIAQLEERVAQADGLESRLSRRFEQEIRRLAKKGKPAMKGSR